MQNLDPVSIAIVIVGTMFGPAVASVAGPYAVIVFCAAIGAAWALGGRDTTSRAAAVSFFLRMIFTAVFLTVATTKGITIWLELDPEESNWLLAPVATVIGGVGDNWMRIFKWVAGRGKTLFPGDKS